MAYKGLAYEAKFVSLPKMEHRSPEFLAMNPQGIVPALVDDAGRVFTQSMAMIEYLDDIHPEWAPKNAADLYREILEARGEEALPYVLRHLALGRAFWSQKPIGADQLIALAESRGWLSLWAAILRSSTPEM